MKLIKDNIPTWFGISEQYVILVVL